MPTSLNLLLNFTTKFADKVGVVFVLAPPPAANVLVYANEYRLDPSRLAAPGNRLHFQVKNTGEDEHDLSIRRRAAGAPVLAATARVLPGALAELDVTLPPGRYVLVCTVGDHAARGMQQGFTVTTRRKSSLRR